SNSPNPLPAMAISSLHCSMAHIHTWIPRVRLALAAFADPCGPETLRHFVHCEGTINAQRPMMLFKPSERTFAQAVVNWGLSNPFDDDEAARQEQLAFAVDLPEEVKSRPVPLRPVAW